MSQRYEFQYNLPVRLPRKATYHFKGNAIKQSGTVYPSLTKNRDGECSYPGTAVHASGAIAPIAFRTCFGNVRGQDKKIHNKRKYIYMVITYSRVWINRVRLPILLVVS